MLSINPMLKKFIEIICAIFIILLFIFEINKSEQEVITYNTDIELIDDSTYIKGIIANDSIYYFYFKNGLHRTRINKIVYDDSLHYYKTDSIIIRKIIGKSIIVNKTFYIPKNSLKL